MDQLYEWYNVSQQLKDLKKKELELRKAVFAAHFPEPAEGTNRVEVPGGELVANYPYRYSLDADKLEEAVKVLPATKQDKIVTWKPTLVKAVYNKLSKKARADFTEACITVKPGSPTLKIEVAE